MHFYAEETASFHSICVHYPVCSRIILFWLEEQQEKDCKQVLIKNYFYTVCSTGMPLQLKGTVYRRYRLQVITSALIITTDPLNTIKTLIQTPCQASCLWVMKRDCLTDPWKRSYQKRPRSHQLRRWQCRWHVSQVPPHHPVSRTLLRGHFLSHERFKKWSWGFFSQDVQGINNYSPKKVGTILKHYFYFVHCRGLLYGKAVGVELRTR